MGKGRASVVLFFVLTIWMAGQITGLPVAGAATTPPDQAALAVRLGTAFADVYTEFAPLYMFYRSYGDYLFKGSPIEVPIGLSEACDRFPYEVALFHIEVSTQTDSMTIQSILPQLIRLRIGCDAYCVNHNDTLSTIVDWEAMDFEAIEQASDAGLFSEIRELSRALEATLDELLDAFVGDLDRWFFGVAFALRGILTQTTIERIDAHLEEILYGSPEAIEAPIPVPEAVHRAMTRLIELSGRELNADEANEARAMAEIVYECIASDPCRNR